ncbi:alpha/beta hydrolase [Fulvivirgaceae bacterium PWU5]|uniref:Alpha/beta hydrolase n=1 Tax=Dawidia cretensis TaxID=2782350 RepID=A0AAP2GT09_9BACT|nr:alpha/beta hydrolase [Dawidia cretensis]MBT1712361.1 alpha/beta hydrolase [Dawidia cretensis]
MYGWLGILLCMSLCQLNTESAPDIESLEEEMNVPSSRHLTIENSIRDVVEHPAFRRFGNHLLPWEDNSRYMTKPLSKVGLLMPYHSNVRPDVVVNALNYMIDQVNGGKTIFYDFYDDRQKGEDPAKAHTGLFFFKGKPNAPFAVVCPGGGFSYVGSLHEGFPLAEEISKKGYNTFVIKYRANSGLMATEDLAAALSFIFDHAMEFQVAETHYSLWGGSAGARMVGDIALSGVEYYGGKKLPRPSTAVIAYTGHSTYSPDFPPTFITVSADDPIADISIVERRMENLKKVGVKVEYRRYTNAGHGFGTGIGTDAEGWINHAMNFWQRSIAD